MLAAIAPVATFGVIDAATCSGADCGASISIVVFLMLLLGFIAWIVGSLRAALRKSATRERYCTGVDRLAWPGVPSGPTHMFEIGASLREARARRQLGYDQIEAETKIRAKYIRCMEDEQFDVLPSGTYVRGFLRTYADYLGLDGQLYVDEYSSRFGDIPDERMARRRERPQQRRNESSNAVLIALAGIVAVGVLLLAAWKLNPSSDRPAAPLPPATPTTTTGSTSQGNPSSFQVQKDQHAAQAKKNHTNVAPAVKPVSLRIDIVDGAQVLARRPPSLQPEEDRLPEHAGRARPHRRQGAARSQGLPDLVGLQSRRR